MEFFAFVAGLLVGAAVVLLAARMTYAARLVAASTETTLLRERVVDLESAVSDDHETASVLAPLSAALQRVERQVSTLERDRVEQFGELGARLRDVGRTTADLHAQTVQLTGALRSSSTSGAWGEVQLRRVLEHSGMLSHCDFDEQVTAVTNLEQRVRPDVVVRLPGDRVLVIDSKAPIRSFLAAQASDVRPDERDRLLDEHATALLRHVDSLAAKAYWSAFERTPEMVVCFLPADAMLGAALRQDPALLDRAMQRKVVLASPSTLLALLRTTAYAWQQDSLVRGAQDLLRLGTTLYERLTTLGRHTAKLGTSLTKSVEAYNAMVGALESRVLVSARQMQALGVTSEVLPDQQPVEVATRPLTAQELIDALDEQVARPMLDFTAPSAGDGAPKRDHGAAAG
ncbi:DNA recombination protein RmuC [Rudaeicoccus suwonensis]|nr:DNA recombination protein RmuC [Rudaeicoccus suwonensis]